MLKIQKVLLIAKDTKGVEDYRRNRSKRLFDWPVTFTKVRLMVSNSAVAKCPEEHENHITNGSHTYI